MEKFIDDAKFIPRDYFDEIDDTVSATNNSKEQSLNLYMNQILNVRHSFDVKGFKELGTIPIFLIKFELINKFYFVNLSYFRK